MYRKAHGPCTGLVLLAVSKHHPSLHVFLYTAIPSWCLLLLQCLQQEHLKNKQTKQTAQNNLNLRALYDMLFSLTMLAELSPEDKETLVICY